MLIRYSYTRLFFRVFLTLLILTFSLYKSFAQANYCVPPPSNCSDFRQYRIDSVSFGNLHNASKCSINGYSDYSSSIPAAVINAKSYVPVTVISNAGMTKDVSVAIDFNQNGIFEKDEITLIRQGTNWFYTLIRIPSNAAIGKTRMRIRIGLLGASFSMCDDVTYGETEDYLINILPPKTTGPHFAFYVNNLGNELGDGSDWDSAFNNLNTALFYAQGRDTIKVAAGTYKPGNTRGSTFEIKDSIILQGGYAATGNPSNADRNFSIHQTILSGELGEINSPYDNISTIITATSYQSVPVLRNFVIDGFIIEGASSSALLMNGIASAEIKNCVFRKNENTDEGAAVTSTYSTPLFTNCYFHENNYYAKSIVNLIGSVPTFINSVFANNSTEKTIVRSQESVVNFTNCNFVSNINKASDPLATIIRAENNSTLHIENSIFYNNILNSSPDISEIVAEGSSTINIHHTITQVYDYGNASLLSKDPKFKNINKVLGDDGRYFTQDDGLHLINPCSPAINTGLNVNGLLQDITGNPRIFGSNTDLGAYEVQAALSAIPATLYVNKLATGKNDGSSWNDAFTDLQNALYYCSDTIKVASNTYTPSQNDENASFWLQNNRVILGGYPSSGNPDDSKRNPSLYPTIFSGNILNSTDKSSVFIVRGRTLDSTAKLDGFILTQARGINYKPLRGAIYLALNASPEIRNCTIVDNETGILIYSGSKPLISESIFENNGAIGIVLNSSPQFLQTAFQNNTGSLTNKNSNTLIEKGVFQNNTNSIEYINSSHPLIINSLFKDNNGSFITSNNSSPEVLNTVFSGGKSASKGGMLYNSNLSKPVFKNCEFKNASAGSGAVCFNDNSNPVFEGCVFRNSQADKGAVFFNQNKSKPLIISSIATHNSTSGSGSFMYSENSRPKVINSTIVNNSLVGGIAAGVFYCIGDTLTILNSILWGNDIHNNRGYTDGEIISNSHIELKNSITQVNGINGENGNMVGINPRLKDITNPAGPDSLYFTTDDGLNLCDCSPAINRGVNGAAEGKILDILNAPRIFNGTIDMGAYEFQSTIISSSKTYYVNASATGANDGSSWANGYKELRSAIQNTCSDTIKVATGIYKPSLASRDSSFYVNRGLTIWGGYPNTGNPSDNNRNPDLFPTILSGDVGKIADSTDNSYNVMKVNCEDTSVNIQGFTFKYGNGGMGGGLYAPVNKDLTIAHCRFYNNYAVDGGALYINGNAKIESSVFSFNSTLSNGTFYSAGGKILMRNCVFNNNIADNGGGVYCTQNQIFENVVFYKNDAKNMGGGVYLSGNPAAQFINCDFIKNNNGLKYYGAGLLNVGGSRLPNPVIKNCIFKDNTSSGHNLDLQNIDWAWVTGSYVLNSDQLDVYNSASLTFSPKSDGSNISPSAVSFRNIEDAIGPDGLWFTEDDGLQVDACSGTIDKGNSLSLIDTTTDITLKNRIYNGRVDIGAYEYSGSFKASLLITASDTVICTGSSISFQASTLYTGTAPFYQWKVNGLSAGINSPIFTASNLADGDQVQCVLTSNSNCITDSTAISNVIKIYANGTVTPSVKITVPVDKICEGIAVIFNATPLHGGTAPSYQWQVNGENKGTDDPVFTSSTLPNNALVQVILTSNLSCALPLKAESNLVSIIVNRKPSAFAGNDTTICAGSNIQFNGSGGAIYSWSPSTGLTNPFIANPVANPVNNILYTLKVTDANNCTSTDSVKINVNPKVSPSVTITSGVQSICSGESMQFDAQTINSGANPSYQWKVNGLNVGNNQSTFTSNTLRNGEEVKVVVTNNIACATSGNVESSPIYPNVICLATPTINYNNKVFVVSNTDTSVAYNWQILNGTKWEDVAPAAHGITYTTTQQGEYRIQASQNQCTVYSASQRAPFRKPTSNVFGIYMYPNPTTGILILEEISVTQKWQTLEIKSMQGQRVAPVIDIKNKTSVTLHLGNLTNGIYFIKLTRIDGEITIFKVVLVR